LNAELDIIDTGMKAYFGKMCKEAFDFVQNDLINIRSNRQATRLFWYTPRKPVKFIADGATWRLFEWGKAMGWWYPFVQF